MMRKCVKKKGLRCKITRRQLASLRDLLPVMRSFSVFSWKCCFINYHQTQANLLHPLSEHLYPDIQRSQKRKITVTHNKTTSWHKSLFSSSHIIFVSCNRPATVSWIWGGSLTAWSWSRYQSGPSVPTGNRPAWHLRRGRATPRQQLEAHEWDRGTEKATQQFLSVARAVRPLKSQMMMNERDQPVGKSPPGCHQPATPLSILIPLLKGFSFQIIHIPMHSDPRHTSEIHADRVDDLVSEIELLHTAITVAEKNISLPLSIGT